MRPKEFYNRLTEGLALSELWSQFRAEARSTYQFYSADVDWDAMEGLPSWKRVLKVAWAFFWAMLMHLSPARRVLLVLSLALVFLGTVPRVQIQSDAIQSNQTFANTPAFGLWGALGILLLLALELADRVVMKRDLQIAREIQHWLVPETPPQIRGLDIAFHTRPANTVGGDFYDVVRWRDRGRSDPSAGSVLFVVADVAGKSVPAALLMATFQASLQSVCSLADSIEDLVARMNESACTRSLGGRRFTTAFFCEIEPLSGAVRFINAGHNYPFLRRADGGIETLRTGGLPLGISSEAAYEVEATRLGPGDLLLIYTDGVVEAVNETGEEFGEARLTERVRGTDPGSAQKFLEALQQDVAQFVGQTRQYDDMTWMVVAAERAWKPGGPPPIPSSPPDFRGD